VIFSLFANSRARSKGILKIVSKLPATCRYPQAYQTPLRCIGPILTTCLVFSLFRIPSLRPRVIPATFSSLVPLIMWLSMNTQSAIDIGNKRISHTFTASDADTFGLDLEAKATFVFP
jgi:hypothetical protein